MAVAVNVLGRGHLGPFKAVLAEVTPDSTYPAGGEPVVPADFGLSQIIAVFTTAAAAAAGAVAGVTKFDRANSKFQIFESGGAAADLAEQNTADQSAKLFVALVIGH